MTVLGINAFHGDAAAALLAGGTIAVEEERFTRVTYLVGAAVDFSTFEQATDCADTVSLQM